MIGLTSLSGLPRLRDYTSRRSSSYDRTGGNQDYWVVQPGEERTLAEIKGPGCVKHIWMTLGFHPDGKAVPIPSAYPRRLLMRAYWEGNKEPSVEAPVGDFFGLGHGLLKDFWSLPLQMSPSEGKAMNSWWPMPFRESGRITITNECEVPACVFFYIDYEMYPTWDEELAYFHVQWRRENPTQGYGDAPGVSVVRDIWGDPNHGDGNYVILDTQGDGIYCGCHLDIDCFGREKNDWYGEGDDMIFIDGEPWPPSLHGTGTEDYFNTAYCPRTEFSTPYHGLILYSGTEKWPWKGKNSVYRYHIEDPIRFKKSVKVTIEHGHNNNLSNDYSSTAYYYLSKPQVAGPPILPVAERLPRPDEAVYTGNK